MSNRTFYPSKSYGSSRVYAEFSFVTNGAGAIDMTKVDGADLVASITRSGTGTFLVKLKDTFNKVVSLVPALDEVSVPDGAYATAGNVANEASQTPVQLTVYTRAAGGTATDYSGRTVRVSMAFRNGNWGVK